MTDTAGILDAARYLRNVRPIDPDEIYEYVEDRPHPAVVRETLRRNAFDLGLTERDDGTFVPLEEGPIDPAFEGVERFPAAYARRFEDRLLERYGANWPEGEAGDRLRARIDELKAAYFADETVTYDEETALAYGLYHLPDYYAAIQYALEELGRDGRLPHALRILDVGAGTGGPALGIHDYLPADTAVEYDAVEPSAAAAVLEAMLAETRPGFGTTVARETAESFVPDGEYDLIVFANVLSELEDPVDVVTRYLDALAPDGTLLAVSPAEERTATRLRSIERAVLRRRPGTTVYAPTVRLWPDERPDDRGWTFTRRPDIEPPGFQRRLDVAGDDDGTYRNGTVQFAYLLLRTDGASAIEYDPDPDRVAKMADSERHVTDRIDLDAVKLSPNLAADGNPVFKIGDGSERIDHYAVLADASALNEPLERAPYGALLGFENALVLWNDDEEAYNLVVDGETFIERLA
ncbi:small ribosomal subunit Rsm22 family protein [Natronomonas sp.]|uniref:small ribosomal subunit Rsm22 family protein n=1 Tax=Natronomonas sp. TaxID=2184060 RepID=UPI00261490B7|nr:class I SAM-dependent methyltransferase [Natronomonas sp.]